MKWPALPQWLLQHKQAGGFCIAFAVIFWGLQTAYGAIADTALHRGLVDVLTVMPAAWLIRVLQPHSGVLALGNQLIAPGIKLHVLSGCEGSESLFLLLAAILPFARPWRAKASGVVLGALLIFVLNQLRLTTLFMVAGSRSAWFEFIHIYLAPTLIILLAGMFFVTWIEWSSPKHAD